MMNNINLATVVKNIKRNTFGVCCTLETEPRMYKKHNPYVGRVTKVTEYVNVALGRDYYTAVENAAARKGLDGSMVHEKPNGMDWFDYPYFLVSDKNQDQYYLRLTRNKNTITKVTYMVDGRVATDDETAEIKSYLYEQSYSAKQAAVGLEEDSEQIRPLSVKIENIVELHQGGNIYNR